MNNMKMKSWNNDNDSTSKQLQNENIVKKQLDLQIKDKAKN